MATVLHETVTTQELRDRLDRLSRERLNLSADEFIERYERGEFSEEPQSRLARLVLLARLLHAAEKHP